MAGAVFNKKGLRVKSVEGRCEDCKTPWTMFASSPMQKCPICGGKITRNA